MEFFDFYRKERWTHIFCPGCGNGIVMNAFYTAFNELNLNIDDFVFVSGIGCSSRIPGYIYGDSIHTTHGRALAVATGIKLANPKLNVVVFTGDGDLGAIGGNHFINACRRNVDLKVICINNNIYGMTGGQTSTTTPNKFFSTTTPYGNKEYPFDLSEIAVSAGANYVARWTTYHVKKLIQSIKFSLQKKGFCFIEVVAQCPTAFGRRNKMEDAVKMLEWFKIKSIAKEKANGDSLKLNIEGIITIGEFVNRERKTLDEMV